MENPNVSAVVSASQAAPTGQAADATAAVETPSGKIAADENFPVGSFLLPSHLRPVIASFYGFARAADDIADNPALSPSDKIKRLDVMDESLLATDLSTRGGHLAALLAAQGQDARHARTLLNAFRQDAEKNRYETLDEVHGYCRMSADPVGRFLVDLHEGGSDAGQKVYPYSDGLCTARQLVNHLQDCGKDFMTMDRAYLPETWLAAAGADISQLRGSAVTPGLRTVLDRVLDDVDAQLARAAHLPRALTSRRLAMESEIIIRLARRLAARLRVGDPLATRVKLTKPDFFVAGLMGAVAGFFKGGRGRMPEGADT
ncbi:MAG: squalene/phytoene synthase family protein [Candidatus Phaeomarinobacter sp.]